jgi:hypothetical protein
MAHVTAVLMLFLEQSRFFLLFQEEQPVHTVTARVSKDSVMQLLLGLRHVMDSLQMQMTFL